MYDRVIDIKIEERFLNDWNRLFNKVTFLSMENVEDPKSKIKEEVFFQEFDKKSGRYTITSTEEEFNKGVPISKEKAKQFKKKFKPN